MLICSGCKSAIPREKDNGPTSQKREAPDDLTVSPFAPFLKSAKIESLIAGVFNDYRCSDSLEDVRLSTLHLADAVRLVKEPAQRLAAIGYAIEVSKGMEPMSRYYLLANLGRALNEEDRQALRFQLYGELIRLVMLDREQCGYTAVPEGRSEYEAFFLQLRSIQDKVHLAGVRLSGRNYTVPMFPSLALAFLDVNPTENERFQAYRSLLFDICNLAPRNGYIWQFCLEGHSSLKKLIRSQGFSGPVTFPGARPGTRPEKYSDGMIVRDFDQLRTEMRIQSLEDQVIQLTRASAALRTRVDSLESRMNTVEQELTRLDEKIDKKFQEALERAAEWVRDAALNGKLPKSTLADGRSDDDLDGIPDDFEDGLVQKFAPRVYYPNWTSDARGQCVIPNAGPPVSLNWLLKQVRFQGQMGGAIGSATNGLEVLRTVSLSEKGSWKLEWLDGASKWGDASHGWCSLGGNQGIYGRVWRPWKQHTNFFSVQYFIFLSNNQPAKTANQSFGAHEGDWLCVDFGIEANGVEDARILHAIYHNHGRQLFLKESVVKRFMEDGRPVVWLEQMVNEPWPNSGGRGYEGWPDVDGFAANAHWDFKDLSDGWTQAAIDTFDTLKGIGKGLTFGLADTFGWFGPEANTEEKVVREHGKWMIGWKAWDTKNIPNLGEQLTDGGKFYDGSLCGAEGRFIAEYPGTWGSQNKEVDNPRSPPFQPKMWKRAYIGPWNILSENPNDDARFAPIKSLPPGIPSMVSKDGVRLFCTEGHIF